MKQLIIILLLILSCSSYTQTYIDFPDTSIYNSGGAPTLLAFDIDMDGTDDVQFSAVAFANSFGGQSITSVEGLDSNRILTHISDTLFAQQLQPFDLFGPNSSTYQQTGIFLSSSFSNGQITHTGYWNNYTFPPKYCAVKFYANNEWNYAWILLKVENGISHAKITLYSLGYWNNEIYAGQGSPDASMVELTSNNKELIKIVDITGKEVIAKPNTVLIYMYSDGTTEKVLKIE